MERKSQESSPASEVDRAGRAILSMRGISMRFGGFAALSEVSFDVWPGEVHAIVGENGAGKSTLMKILAGVYTQSAGHLLWEGQEIKIGSPRVAQGLGIRMVYQELSLIPDLSVAENICLGRMPRRGPFLDLGAMRAQALRALGLIGCSIDPSVMIEDLSISQRQLVEIARVVSSGVRIVVLDEPTSSLSEHEAQNLLAVVRTLKGRGIGVIYISHRLHEVLAIAERVTVLRDGSLIETRDAKGTTAQDLVRMMVGRTIDDVFPKAAAAIGGVVFKSDKLTGRGFRGIDIEVRAGEIVGVAGLVGAGRTEFARAVFGLDPIHSGTVSVDGHPLPPRRPRGAIKYGIAYVPEDRRLLGIVPPLTVRENLTISALRRISTAGFINITTERKEAMAAVGRLAVNPPRIEGRIDTLSGGNQQKVVLGRWLATSPRLLILDEPTRGVDVGAKAEIHRIIGGLAQAGVAILLISSELPEVIAASDRIYVFHEGVVSGELVRDEATEEAVMTLATGAKNDIHV